MLKRFRKYKAAKSSTQDEDLQIVPASTVNAPLAVITLAPPTPVSRKPSTGSSFVFDRRATSTSNALESRPSLSPGNSSSFTLSRARERSASPKPTAKSLGLHVLSEPEDAALVDIVFVHGLGGDSRKTWSRNHDPALCWPQTFLPEEPETSRARILTFGYNANFRPGEAKSIATVSDFAKTLLFDLRFGRDHNDKELNIGRVPLMFVVHSMGGLVTKKAYLLGQNDENYKQIIQAIGGIIFLATPHRGTNLAETLNRVLTVSFQSPKSFIMDLNKNSSTLEELNEQFRHIAPRLSIWSFYETLATPVGPKKIMVLEKDSSILGYPNEISRPLSADHHGVCKFSGVDDPNYVNVRNAIRTLVGCLTTQAPANGLPDPSQEKEKMEIQKLFSAPIDHEDDYYTHRRSWVEGTCDWLLLEDGIPQWLEMSTDSNIAWFTAAPASGKSILSTHLINHLQQLGISCQYFFFHFGDQRKRSISSLLQSIAYQAAQDIPAFRRGLLKLAQEGFRLDKADPTFLWQKIFEDILFEIDYPQPFYWIIDGLDESDSPKKLLDLLRNITKSNNSIRIFITSRKTEVLHLAFERVASTIPITRIDKDGADHNADDIRVFVEQEIKHMRGSDQLKQRIVDSLMERAEGNFLWTRLVLEEISSCHTEQSIQEALAEIPGDMNALYERMEAMILNQPRKSNRALARSLLEWSICSRRSLSLLEMSQALSSEFPELLDLERTIRDICGQFIRVDVTGHVTMVHQTARDFLIQPRESDLYINVKDTHLNLFKKSISVLLHPGLQTKVLHEQETFKDTYPFIFYAALSWSFHLRFCGATTDELLSLLVKFLKGQSLLVWVHVLSMTGQLEILIKASKTLSEFTKATRKLNSVRNPMLHRLSDLEVLDLWSIDLVKLVGKFGRHLVTDPQSIYNLVPPFCPQTSAVHRQFYNEKKAEVSVSGLLNSAWTDNLTKIHLPEGMQAWQLLCAGQHVAVLSSRGTVSLWNTDNFLDAGCLEHGEPVTITCINSKGNMMVTYGLKTTKLWSIPSGELLYTTANDNESRAMTMTFSENDTQVLSGGDDNSVRYLQVDNVQAGWQVVNPMLLKETSVIEGTVLNSPMCMAFSGDSTMIGVSYRGFPLSVWSLSEGRCLNRCRRVRDSRHDDSRPSTNWSGVDRLTWNPITNHVIGIYRDGCIFKWHPLTDENQEAQSAADEIAASPNGKLFCQARALGW